MTDQDPQETREWLDALAAVVDAEGVEKAAQLIDALEREAEELNVELGNKLNTPYINTIPYSRQPQYPGNDALEMKITSLIRWNALAMVVRANKLTGELGGHISTFASSATLYEVGFNHFFKGPDHPDGADLIYYQGHSSPGIYARAFLEGRLSEAQLEQFRQEAGSPGLSSYPHPWLMPEFWQFPTVSMGLGPIMGIYQARFLRYLENRELIPRTNRKVWVFMGDGESDEPESLGAISLASREKLDNLIFVINCNLQRLDGPVRGNGKIIQELEGIFRGADWNVLKVLWGTGWDALLDRDEHGLLRRVMDGCVDGEYQNFKQKGGNYTRENFFGKYPELKEMVAGMSDDEIWRLKRGGHDAHKIYAAYHEATSANGKPTVILAKTVKGYGMGEAGEGFNTAHQQKKMDEEGLRYFRDRFRIPIPDEQVGEAPYYILPEDSEELSYLRERRKELGGSIPIRHSEIEKIDIPDLSAFEKLLEGTGEKEMSTTMAFVRVLNTLIRNKDIGRRVVPIVPDEARTFGMEGMFRQVGIYSAVGQLYEPQDSDQLMYYKESIQGQILEEGITEAGAMSSWIAAATSYSTNQFSMIPFYIFYSMFGFQRVGDLAWAGGDMQARGFLLGATAGRTTLAGEGLQHQDGHSQLVAGTIPNCLSYDPAYHYELAVIIQDGLRRMYGEGENLFYYITVMNENYSHPPMPEGAEEGIRRGIYLLRKSSSKSNKKVQLLGSGTILNEVVAAAELLENDYGVAADVWSVTSVNNLAREADDCERWNMLNPAAEPRVPYITEVMNATEGPVVAATDYTRAYVKQIAPFLDRPLLALGTDGFGRSDTRYELRKFFEVNRHYVTLAALQSLAKQGALQPEEVAKAIAALEIDTEKPNPITC